MLKQLAFRVLSSLLLIVTILDFDAHAYIDPGSGSVLLQLILGGIAGIGVVVKLYWGRIKDRYRSIFGGPGKPDQ
jgi:hypothetical protein